MSSRPEALLPDEHDDAERRADRQHVQQHRLQRQQHGPQRPREQRERHDRDERDHQRERGVDRLREVAVLCGWAAHRRVAGQRQVAHGVERRSARRRTPRRRPGSASSARRSPSRQRASAGATTARTPSTPRSCAAAASAASVTTSIGVTVPAPSPESSSAVSAVRASPPADSASTDGCPGRRPVATTANATSTAIPATAAGQRRRTTKRAQRVHPAPASRSRPLRRRSSRAPSAREHDGQQGQRRRARTRAG